LLCLCPLASTPADAASSTLAFADLVVGMLRNLQTRQPSVCLDC
jgi:hypothetical protein